MNDIKRLHIPLASLFGLVLFWALLSSSTRVSAIENYSIGTGSDKASASAEQNGNKVALPITKWETGTLITKDPVTGVEVREQFKYPVFGDTDFHIMGDNTLCWQVCKDACDGYGVCHAVCWSHCASQGGEGDPRKK